MRVGVDAIGADMPVKLVRTQTYYEFDPPVGFYGEQIVRMMVASTTEGAQVIVWPPLPNGRVLSIKEVPVMRNLLKLMAPPLDETQ